MLQKQRRSARYHENVQCKTDLDDREILSDDSKWAAFKATSATCCQVHCVISEFPCVTDSIKTAALFSQGI